MSCPACFIGSLDEGQPRGTEQTLGPSNTPCYVVKPTKDANGHAIIIATDVFGYKLVNARLIADTFADQGFMCVVPDCFNGEPASDTLILLEQDSWPNQSLLGKAMIYGKILWAFLGMATWIRRHPVSQAVEVISQVAATLHAEHGISKLGVQGYCYGGKVAILLAARPEVVDAACIAHPGLIKVPDDINPIVAPVLFLCADWDLWFPESTYTKVLEILEAKQPGLGAVVRYPGTRHGFAVRASAINQAAYKAREDALQQGIKFFKKHLCGEAPQQMSEFLKDK